MGGDFSTGCYGVGLGAVWVSAPQPAEGSKSVGVQSNLELWTEEL